MERPGGGRARPWWWLLGSCDGCIDLDAIFQTLKKIGWQEDVVSLELFRPEYYKMDPEDVYRIGKEKSEAVIKRNF